MGRRSPSRAGILDGSSSISSTTTIVRVAQTGRAKKRSTRPQMSYFLPKISVKQWRSEKFQKGGHNFHTFLIVFLFGRTSLKLIEKQERFQGGPEQGRKSRGDASPPIIYRTLLFLMIYLADSMASRFLLWLRIATAFFLFTHLINKGLPSIVHIAEKKMKLCFLYAAEQRCSKKKRDERC